MVDYGEDSDCPQFEFKMIGRFRDCFSRQVAEALKKSFTQKILNSKKEYMLNCLSRLFVDENAYERKKREIQEEDKETVNDHLN